jgi:hypothetical protein
MGILSRVRMYHQGIPIKGACGPLRRGMMMQFNKIIRILGVGTAFLPSAESRANDALQYPCLIVKPHHHAPTIFATGQF